MMRLLVFVLCVQSLSQLLPSALAKPDFGVKLPIKSSGKVSDAILSAKTVLIAADDNTPFTADATYKGLQELADVMVRIATDLVNTGSELVPIVTSLVADVSGDVTAAFATVSSKIATLKSAITTKLPIAITDIKAVFKTHFASEGLDYIPNQLNDGFRRIGLGLDDLAAKLDALKKAIEAAGTEVGGVSEITEALVKQYVKPALLYDAVFSINQLKAYLPVVKYTIDSTLENINLADDYLVLVTKAVGDSSTASQPLLDSVKAVTDGISKDVKDELNLELQTFKSINTDIKDKLTYITAATDIAKVNSALSSYDDTFTKLGTEKYPAMDGQLKALLDAMSNALSGGTTTGQLSSPLLDSLILTAIENGKFAQFCFHKYFLLVFGFLTSLTDSSASCFDKEVTRLEYLRETLSTIDYLFPPDFESLYNELSICDVLTAPAKLNECIQALGGFYTELSSNFNLKVQYLFELIENETVASKNRFLICIEIAKINLVEFTEAGLISDIRACALTGPTADD